MSEGPPTAVATPSAAPAPPAASPAAAAPISPASAAPNAGDAAAATTAPAVPAAAAEAAPEASAAPPAPAATVLGDALASEAPPPSEEPAISPQPAEAAPTETEKDAGPSDEPAPPPSYEPFSLPDGVTVEPERLGAFTGLLGQFESDAKADHAKVQEFGQQLVDYHIAEVQSAIERQRQSYEAAWNRQRQSWKETFLADPELGGARFQTTVDAALNFIRTHGGDDAQQAEFRQLMDSSGLGNHPAMLRLLANAGMAMREGQPLAATTPVQPPRSKLEKMYGRKG